MTTAAREDSRFAARAAVHTEDLGEWGRVRIVALVPDEDIDLVHRWVGQERGRFWGMTALARQDVLDIYQFLDSLETHHAFLVLLDGEPPVPDLRAAARPGGGGLPGPRG
ncbi:GNAT family N-acetyltransferase [Pseudarthrobacter sp. P1]|uniref:GNAT family N-acetyltransferase n=1 Tax=Pseudarthrobacter sp. P1 TaxID=3418418 RepID=UPI003CEBBF4A